MPPEPFAKSFRVLVVRVLFSPSNNRINEIGIGIVIKNISDTLVPLLTYQHDVRAPIGFCEFFCRYRYDAIGWVNTLVPNPMIDRVPHRFAEAFAVLAKGIDDMLDLALEIRAFFDAPIKPFGYSRLESVARLVFG